MSLPPDLAEWLDQRAADLGVDREEVLVQLLSSYRAAEDLGDDLASTSELLGPETVEPAVKEVLGQRLPDLTDAVSDRVAADLREELTDELRDRLAADVRAQLEDDLGGIDDGTAAELRAALDDLEDDYRDSLDDVRQRVIQVKRDADAKADSERVDDLAERIEALEAQRDSLDGLADALDRLDRVEEHLGRLDGVERNAERLGDIETELDGVESDLATLRGEVEAADTDRLSVLESDLQDAREKLQTVAYVVRDLRDAVEGGGAGQAALDGIKAEAAEADVSRASCGNCGNGVQIGLLTDPSCPHCDATLDGLEPSGRPFGLGSATLTVAAGLESGIESSTDDELDEISTANRGDRR